MPTITLNKTVFERLVGKKLSLEQLKNRISMLGTGLEKIEDNEIQVEIFPNRPDLLSEQGLARAFSSFIGVKKGLRKYEVKKSGLKVVVDSSVSMRPYTACAIVKKLSFNDEKIREIMQAQEKLATTHGRNRKKSAYGIYPAKEIVFPIHYIAKDAAKVYFRPLGFDREISAAQVEELHPKGKEYKDIAKGWSKYPFFRDNSGKIMSMLPYINSHDMGKVDEGTKEVFIECTGTDLQNVLVALNIFAAMFADMGGDIYSVDVVYHNKTITTPNLTPRKMKLDLKYINQRLGLNLKDKEAKELLGRMGYGAGKSEVLVPAYRVDVLHQVDLAEDIAIAYGYEHFPEIIPKVATVGEELPLEKFMVKIREILIGVGLIEVKNYHLITALELNEKMNLKEKLIPLKNALGDYNHLRNAIIPSLLKTLMENQHNEYPQNIFEMGRTFFLDEREETGVKEIEKLAMAVCHEKADFTELKQMLDLLISTLGWEYKVKECVLPSYIPGRVGKIVCQGVEIGCIGELHPQVLENWNLMMPTIVLELDVEKLFRLVK
ncbi:phenylalanine--tRNA ligase subunit beta [Candidatus Woesearchaeota archaeon]|nr:phenylalanine--tRNA ligase subunit beta [Candidatus Woesearchaeota archaeon]